MRELGTPHQALPSGTSDDYLAMWRCNEAAAFDDFADALGVRTLVAGGSGCAPVASPFADASQTFHRGGRVFDPTNFDYGVRAVSDGDHTFLQGLAWGIACWVDITTLRNSTLVEYGSTGETGEADNVQCSLRTLTTGKLREVHETTSQANVVTDTDWAGLTTGKHHVGVASMPSPNFHDRQMLLFYFDGECIHIADDVALPTGGSGSNVVWSIGGDSGGGSNFEGTLDDIVVTKFTPSHEWFRRTYARGVRDFQVRCDDGGDQSDSALVYEVYGRVLVEVGTAAFPSLPKVNLTDIDLSNLETINFVRSMEWGEHVDDADSSAHAELWPRYGFYNLSPFATGAIRDMFRERRRIKFETAVVPVGTTRAGVGPHWQLAFDGWALVPDVAALLERLTVAGKGAALYHAWVEPAFDGGDRQYGTTSGIAVQTEMQRVIDEMDPARFEIRTIDDNGTGAKIIAVLHFVSESAVINPPPTRGREHPFASGDSIKISGTTNYNGVMTVDIVTDFVVQTVETGGALPAESTGILMGVPALSYKGGKPTIWCPTSPGWNLFLRNEPASKSVGQLLEDWADEIGWRCAYRWHDLRQEFRLKFYDPRSSPATISRTSRMVLDPERLAVHHDDQRTVGRGIYAAGNPALGTGTLDTGPRERTRQMRTVKDITNLRADGRYWFLIDVGSDGLIHSSSEMDLLLSTVLADIKDASSEGVLPCLYDPQPELHDVLALDVEQPYEPKSFDSTAGNVYYGAIAAVRHRLAAGEARTFLELRKVSTTAPTVSIARARRHIERLTAVGQMPGQGLSPVNTPAAPTITNLGSLNGNRACIVSWTRPVGDGNRAWKEMEIHMSSSGSTFTPSSSTLKRTSPSSGTAIAHGFGVGVTVYVKLVGRDEQGNRSQPSSSASFVS